MWQQLIRITRDYFYVSHREARGTLVLIILMLIVIIGTYIYRNTEGDYSPISSLTPAQIDSLFQEKEDLSHTIYLRSFNPNTESDFESLVVPYYITNRIIKYRTAGCTFKIKTDLSKIYGLSDSLYQTLEPYIDLPHELETPKKVTYKNTQKYTKLYSSLPPKQKVINYNFNLRTVDSLTLITFPGIGNIYASRIVKYRNRLGGFHSPNQLFEVYGLPKETAQQLLKHSFIDSISVAQLNLNKVTFKQLLKHPYLEYEDVQNIFNFKRKFGGFNQVNDLQKHQLISDSIFVKVAPYLKI